MNKLMIVILIGILLTVAMLYYFSEQEKKSLSVCQKAYDAFTNGSDMCPAAELFCPYMTNSPATKGFK